MGRGHTDHDLVIRVPEAGALFAGDVVVKSDFPVLRRFVPARLPGHGRRDRGPRLGDARDRPRRPRGSRVPRVLPRTGRDARATSLAGRTRPVSTWKIRRRRGAAAQGERQRWPASSLRAARGDALAPPRARAARSEPHQRHRPRGHLHAAAASAPRCFDARRWMLLGLRLRAEPAARAPVDRSRPAPSRGCPAGPADPARTPAALDRPSREVPIEDAGRDGVQRDRRRDAPADEQLAARMLDRRGGSPRRRRLGRRPGTAAAARPGHPVAHPVELGRVQRRQLDHRHHDVAALVAPARCGARR